MSVFKILALVSVTFASITVAEKEDMIILDRMLYIHYPVQFGKRGKKVIKALINFDSKVNAITPDYAKYLGLQT